MNKFKNTLLGLLLLSAGSISIADDEANGPDRRRGPDGENERPRMQREDRGQGEGRQEMRGKRGDRDGDDRRDVRDDKRRGPDGDDDRRRDRRRPNMGNDGDENGDMDRKHRRHKKKGSNEEGTSEAPRGKLRDPAEFHQVVNDYKGYVAKVPPEVREEVIAFRKEVARLNKEKGMLYKKLSTAAQEYLNKERQYKKKLPTNRKDLIKTDAPAAAPAAKK